MSDVLRAYDPKIDFANEAVWLCINRHNNYRTKVNGALAQILLKYPNDYELRGPYCWTPFEAVNL